MECDGRSGGVDVVATVVRNKLMFCVDMWVSNVGDTGSVLRDS